MAGTLITDRRTASATYRIIRRLGKGGMAEVFLAEQSGMAGIRRLAVVKKILPQFSEVSSVADMLVDEARIAYHLSHPNIVQLYELGQDEGQYFIAMEFVDGCDLATLARIERHRQSRIPIRLTLRVVSEAAMGLDYAHRKKDPDGRPLNVIHRDVSPHNVMCSREGSVKITDFGIAKAINKEQVTEVGVVKGKVQYMAPEQYTGAELDHRADIYSLGVVLYQLTTGKLPRATRGGDISMKRVIEGKIPLPREIRPDYPEELETIVMRALAHVPDDRYPDCASFRDDLLDFARQHDMLAFPKELGDYVNELVPAPEEGAQAADSQVVGKVLGASPGADEKKERGSSLAASRSVVDDERGSREAREALDTVTFGTERVPTGLQPELSVTPSAVISAEDASGPMRRGNISGVDERAVLSHEGLTPAPIERARRRRAAADDHGRGRGSREEDDLADEGQTIRDGDLPRDAGGRLSFSRGAPRRDISLVDARGGGRLSSGREGFSGLFVGLFGVLLMLGVGVAVYFAVSDRTAPPAGTGTAAGGRSSLVADGGGGRASTRAIAGTLDVDANPMSATVFIDGAQRCDGKTRCRIEALPLGTLLVTVKAPGYRIWNQRVVLTPTKATLTLRPVLTREGVSGALEAPDGRSVTKDGGSSKPSSAGSGGKRPSKRHGTARPEKHPGKRRSAHGGKGAPAIPGVVPQKGKGRLIRGKIAGKMAMIVVDVRPAWAEVWVDGKMLGPTPILRPIKPGRHRVDLRNPKMKFHVYYRLKVKAGDKIKIADTISPKH